MNGQSRKVKTIIEPMPVIEGAGVRLKRSLGGEKLNYLDPFLLLDQFGADHAKDDQAGFSMHLHRGIETVTYMLRGEVHHCDTLGNAGSIGSGDVQWMTAGGGILHEKMPQVRSEGNAGFQLWVNLPARLKMTQPRYQDIRSEEISDVYEHVHNGVYRTGFATSQRAYEQAVKKLFDALDQMKKRLSARRYLFGRQIVETDWKLFVTLI